MRYTLNKQGYCLFLPTLQQVGDHAEPGDWAQDHEPGIAYPYTTFTMEDFLTGRMYAHPPGKPDQS